MHKHMANVTAVSMARSEGMPDQYEVKVYCKQEDQEDR